MNIAVHPRDSRSAAATYRNAFSRRVGAGTSSGCTKSGVGIWEMSTVCFSEP